MDTNKNKYKTERRVCKREECSKEFDAILKCVRRGKGDYCSNICSNYIINKTRHLKRHKYENEILISKKCSKCNNWLDTDMFADNQQKLSKKDDWCIVCKRIKRLIEVYNCSYEEALPFSTITTCQSCGVEDKYSLHIDHNHITGKIRGIICSPCNLSYGLFSENPERILSLYKYALTHSNRINNSPPSLFLS